MQDTNTTNLENVVITTPQGGHTVELRPFATGRLRKETRGVFLKYVSVDGTKFSGKSQDQLKNLGDDSDFTKFADSIPAEVMNEIKELTVKNMVVTIKLADGRVSNDRETFVDTCLDMSDIDYDFIVAECDKIAGSSDLSDKKKDS
jgi:hypothetical protein